MEKVCLKALRALLVLCTATLFISTAAFAMPGYDLTDLGIPVGDYTGTTATGINDSGQVSGTLHSHDHPDVGDDHNWAFVWHKTTGFQVLGDPGYKYLEAMGISNSGQVVGGARAYSGNNYALFWENGSITNLGIGRANDINNSGQIVVGNQSVGSSFIWDSSNGKQFLSGSDYIYPWGINDLGQVVGEARNLTPGFDTQAFIWDATNGLKFLYQPAEYMTSSARDMNNSGQVVGMAHYADYPHSHVAVLWNDANTIVKLSDYHATALAINEAGQVVGGASMPGEGYIHGFIWDEVNGLRDLNQLILPYQGLEFIGYAFDINEAGQIAANARMMDGKWHAVLLTPIAEVDTDDDGIPDDQDQCVNSDLSTAVEIDGCHSGVPNTLFSDGCTISDNIAAFASNSINHGEFVNAVASFTNDLMGGGVITGKQKGAIQSCAGQAAIP